MSQINPKQIVERGIVKLSKYSSIQQVGIDLSIAESITVKHGCSQNILLNETISLPKDIYGTFTQRSSYSRLGIFVTSGIYDAGYSGSLGCTVYNLSGSPITINIGERIGQLICYKADAASSYNGQWQNQ